MKIGLVMPASWGPLLKYLPVDIQLPEPLIFNFGAELAVSLRELGHEVHIFTLCHHFSRELHVAGDRVNLHIGGYRRGAWKYILDFYRVENKILSKMLKDYPCDILHAHWTYEFALPVVGSGLPHVVSMRDAPLKVLQLYRPKTFRVMTCLLAYYNLFKAENVLTASPYMAAYCRKWHIYKRSITVIPNAVPEKTFAAGELCPTPDGTIVFACIANGFRGCKNIDTLLKAFDILIRSTSVKCELRLYGGQHVRNGESEIWARQHNLQQNVVFCGHWNHDELMTEVRRTVHVLVHPSLEESFGNVIAEAMALGLPTIVGENSGAAPWVAGQGKAGFLVDIRKPAALAVAMKKMAEDGLLRERMGNEARNLASQRYALPAIVQKHIELYMNIVGH